MVKNKYVNKKDLRNESSVEQFFIIRLLEDLGYRDVNIKTKESIEKLTIGKGSRKEKYKPDYVLVINQKPVLCIDAKDPNENVDDYIYQTSGYSLALNQKYKDENPVKYFILTNGIIFKLFKWDEEKPILTLEFGDFKDGNDKYENLVKIISYTSIKELSKSKKVEINVYDEFLYEKPPIDEVKGVFIACHNLIWKKEKIGPTDAFYEFSKIIFIKLNEDKRIRKLIESSHKLKKEDFVFSLNWIEKEEKTDTNPVNSILFKNLRNELEDEIIERNKKRIFEKNEDLNLKPSTVKEVVKLLEHLDLYSIDEDLNGRMFETFLNATVRGKELGQFFTPRSVVKLMVKLARLKTNQNNMDSVLDACCGSAGFLIDAMADMTNRINSNKALTNVQKEKLKEELRSNHLFGIDANPKITKIARMNMYVHGDGGSRIYCFDSLDKSINIETGIDQELKRDLSELKKILITDNKKFDVVLTNPPFSMKYEAKKKDEKKILEQYELAYVDGIKESNKLKTSLKSNVLFLERYLDLLKPHGKLITVIDESVLNASSYKEIRDFIKKHFVIKAVVSLPWNTFVNAGTGVKTSVLFLIKKKTSEESQPSIFMGISENVGHNDSGKPQPEKSDLDTIFKDFLRFENE